MYCASRKNHKDTIFLYTHILRYFCYTTEHMKNKRLEQFDLHAINFLRKYGDEFGRIAFFVVFVWFGILKVFEVSPAGDLVSQLFEATFLSNLGSPEIFLILFGILEVGIGVMSLIPKLERITFLVMAFHLTTTVLPLFVIPDAAWTSFLVPTLVGQYIMKNIALLALGMLLLARIKPMSVTHTLWAEDSD